MRRTKIQTEKLLEEQSVQVEELNALNRSTILVFLLNTSEGIEPGTKTPLSPAIQERMQDAVMTVKTCDHSLSLLGGDGSPKKSAEVSRCLDLLRPVGDLLRGVRLVPEIVLSPGQRSLTSREYLWSDPAIKKEGWLYDGALTVAEEKALLALCEIVKRGHIDDLRRCGCGDWFLAVRSDQKSCSASCRQRKHANGEAFNKQRRERYALKKQRENARSGKGKSNGKAAK